MKVLGIIISVCIVGGMLGFIGLAIYHQIQKIRGKDKKSKKEQAEKEKSKKGGD
ncbi:MAG: hypothetical protein ACRC8P_01495 [Spiroplasma sp.]